MLETRVPFIDLPRQHCELMPLLLAAAERVLNSGAFILGEEVEQFEGEFARFTGARYAVGVHSGTDALILSLKWLKIGPGDEVITAPNSFIASASSIALAGAIPRFADVGDDYNLDPDSLERQITPRTKAILVVHLTGRPARMREILEIADQYKLRVIEDCAQAVGAYYEDKQVGNWGDIGCFSFHPLKNLNACGDGGAIITQDKDTYEWMKNARNHGLKDRDTCAFWSANARLDALQAAFLRVKLPFVKEWNHARRENAQRYRHRLANMPDLVLPAPEDNIFSVYHLFIIRHIKRDKLRSYLAQNGIDCKIHYPTPIHLQPAAGNLGYTKGDFPRCEHQAQQILSLPVHQYLKNEQIETVIDGIIKFKD